MSQFTARIQQSRAENGENGKLVTSLTYVLELPAHELKLLSGLTLRLFLINTNLSVVLQYQLKLTIEGLHILDDGGV